MTAGTLTRARSATSAKGDEDEENADFPWSLPRVVPGNDRLYIHYGFPGNYITSNYKCSSVAYPGPHPIHKYANSRPACSYRSASHVCLTFSGDMECRWRYRGG